MSFQGFQGLQGFGSQAAAAVLEQGASVVLFPAEPIRFKSKADRALYVLAMLARDARKPERLAA